MKDEFCSICGDVKACLHHPDVVVWNVLDAWYASKEVKPE